MCVCVRADFTCSFGSMPASSFISLSISRARSTSPQCASADTTDVYPTTVGSMPLAIMDLVTWKGFIARQRSRFRCDKTVLGELCSAVCGLVVQLECAFYVSFGASDVEMGELGGLDVKIAPAALSNSIMPFAFTTISLKAGMFSP